MNENKNILKNSAILYIRLIITSIFGLIATRILLHALGVSDYGLYVVVGGIVQLMAFLNTVMVTTTYRFIAYELGKNNLLSVNQIFNISLIIHLVLALSLILFIESIGVFYIKNYLNIESGNINKAIFVLRYSGWGVFFAIISIPYQGLVTAHEKFSVRASIEVIKSFFQLISVIIITFYIGDRLKLYSVLIMFVMFIPSILFFLYCKKNYYLQTKWNFQKQMSKYKEMIYFSGYIMIGAGASVGKSQGVVLIINSFFGTVLNASTGIANQINTLITMFSRNISQAAIPQIIKSFSAGNNVRSTELAVYISKYSFFLILFPALPIFLETDFILKIWLTNVPPYTAVFIKLMIIYALIENMNAGVPAAVQATGKIKWFQIINSILLLLGLPIGFFLFSFGMAPYFILIVYIFIRLLLFLTTFILLKKIIHFNVKLLVDKCYSKIIKVVILLLPFIFLHNLFIINMSRFIVTILLSLVLYIIVVFNIGLEKKEQKAITKILKNRLKK